MQFQGFKPEAMQRIAGTLGYDGDMSQFDGYLEGNPEAKKKMGMYNQQAVNMMNGGMVRSNYEEGGVATVPKIKKDTIDRMKNPALPTGGKVTATGTSVKDNQLLSTTDGTGQLSSTAPTGDVSSTGAADKATATDTRPTVFGTTINPEINTSKTVDKMDTLLDGTGKPKEGLYKDDSGNIVNADGTPANIMFQRGSNTDFPLLSDAKIQEGVVAEEAAVSNEAKVKAEETTESSVSELEAAEGESVDVEAVAKRVLDIKEKIDPVANAADAAKFTEEIEAATATPSEKATVKGQLAELMTDFEGGETPAWAAGALRAASAAMAARGLGSSSMAGQALVQAAMEASLPIAMADAGTFAKFESQNLSNRQQRAMLAAEQRATFMGQEFDQTFQAKVLNASKVSDIANLNFTAEQQVALENSRIANTVNLANLGNKQALIMAEAAALSQLELTSLNNRQIAEVKNSENLMAMDFANLSNVQAMNVFNAQTRTQALFSDVAAENAAEQFNATSQNQTDQFFASLTTQNSQFNVAQTNAINQFNAGETNAQSRFTSEMMNNREQFNANNKMAIEQSNVVWRRTVATADTESINRVNELNASAALGISNTAYNNMWQYFADTMENAYTATNSERDRMTKLAVAKLEVDSAFDVAKWQADASSSAAMGNAIVKIATTSFTGDTIFEKGWDWLTKSK